MNKLMPTALTETKTGRTPPLHHLSAVDGLPPHDWLSGFI